jgi:hypothetical protein
MIGAALIALAALTIVSTTCGGTGLRKPAGTTPVTTPSTGTTEWVHTWDGSGYEGALALAIDGRGNLYTAGYTGLHTAEGADALLLKHSPEGALLWWKAWTGPYKDFPYDIAIDGTGSVYVTGISLYELADDFGTDCEDIFVLKYSPSGELLWQKRWGEGGFGVARAIAVDRRGDVYVAGAAINDDDEDWDALILKCSPNGDLIWQRSWGGDNGDIALDIAVTESGEIYITGQTSSFGEGRGDVMLLKYSPEGNLLDETIWGGGEADDAYALAFDGNGNIYIAGWTYSFSARGHPLVFLLKFSSNGDLLWQSTWGGELLRRTSAGSCALVVDGSGNAYLMACSLSIDFRGFSSYLLKYAADGHIIWQRAWTGSDDDIISALAIDPSRTLYIGGSAIRPYGGWEDTEGLVSSPSGVVGTPEGEERIPEITEVTPEGVETEPEGTIDEGGILIMKYDPS